MCLCCVWGSACQRVCWNCGSTHSRKGHRHCWPCEKQRKPTQPATTTLRTKQQVTHNVTELMRTFPPHSHHRAPLVHHLSRGLDSTTAAHLLHCSPSYVRQCKRKNYSDADLLQDKYARDVKRQRTDPAVLTELCEFLAASCPTKSGDRSTTFHQYVSDDALYQAYCTTALAPVSDHTFYNIKKWMRVKHAGKYLGQFDCSKCLRLNQLQLRPQLSNEEGEELQRCRRHEEIKNFNAISTSSAGRTSNPTNCSC